MRTQFLAKLFVGLLFLFISSSLSMAQDVSKTGTTAAHFLEVAIGAPAVGMGGAFVSIANDATALYWNVSGIATLKRNEAILVHTRWIAETDMNFAGLVIPLAEFGTLGISFTSLSMDDMLVRSVEKPEGTGEYFSAGDMAIGLSYARNLTDRFSIGFTAKYIQQQIWHMRASAFALDLGTLFRTDLLGGMIIGAALSNFGTPMKLVGRDTRFFIRVDDSKLGSSETIPTNIEMDEWDLPLTFRIGVSSDAIRFGESKVILSVDAINPNNDNQSLNFGTEFSFGEYLFLRGGYNSLGVSDAEGGLSFGVGLNSKMLFSETYVQFDYAFRDFGRLQSVHNFSLGIIF